MTPLIIEAAINGATPKGLQCHVPETHDEIVACASSCVKAGASIIHHHNTEGLLQARHASAPYAATWTAIRERHPGTILYPTMGSGGAHTTIEERYAHIRELDDAGLLEMSIIDPGSVSLGPFGPDGLPVPVDLVYYNTFADARYMAEICRDRALAVHISIFEPGFLRVALAYHAAGWFSAGVKIQLYFGGDALPFGLPPAGASLEAYLSMLAGTTLPWMVGVIGGDVSTSLAEFAIRCGGHVRVGLEDYWGPRQPSNEELVGEIVEIARRVGRPVATRDEAAHIIGMRTKS